MGGGGRREEDVGRKEGKRREEWGKVKEREEDKR